MISNLIDKVKHQFSRDKALSSALYDIMGFYPPVSYTHLTLPTICSV